MADDPIHRLSVPALAAAVRNRQLCAVEVAGAFLDRIEQLNPDLNAFVHVDAAGALRQAQAVDDRIAAGQDPGLLAGVPVGVKDLEDVAGLPTRSGSLLTGKGPAAADSTQVARLRAAGAVILGKTATPEFGSLVYTWSPLNGVTRNPWDRSLTPGGSSGGSAAALAAGLVPLATASDGGGSIRIPAGYCGLVGLKPTNGLVPRGPRRHSAGGFSSYGPMATTVAGTAVALDVAAGHHPMDPQSVPKAPVPYRDSLDRPRGNLRVVWSDTLGYGECDREVSAIARKAAERLIAVVDGIEVEVPVKFPDTGDDWVWLWAASASIELAHLPEHKRKLLSPAISEALELAASNPGPARDAPRRSFGVLRRLYQVFQRVDLVVTPTMPFPAFDAGGPMPRTLNGHPVPGRYHRIDPPRGACFTLPFNLTGHPAVSLPAGLDARGVPVGMQVIAPRFEDGLLLAIAAAFEAAEDWPRPDRY